jgi:hypothetical protein
MEQIEIPFTACPPGDYGQIVYIAVAQFDDIEWQPLQHVGVFSTREEAEDYLRGCRRYNNRQILECPIGGAFNLNPYMEGRNSEGDNPLRFARWKDPAYVGLDPDAGVHLFSEKRPEMEDDEDAS